MKDNVDNYSVREVLVDLAGREARVEIMLRYGVSLRGTLSMPQKNLCLVDQSTKATWFAPIDVLAVTELKRGVAPGIGWTRTE